MIYYAIFILYYTWSVHAIHSGMNLFLYTNVQIYNVHWRVFLHALLFVKSLLCYHGQM